MVGISRTTKLQKQMLEEKLASLSEQCTVVNEQMNSERDARSHLLLKKQGDELLEQMKQVEMELNQLEASENNPNQKYIDIKKNLPEIDFDKARKLINKELEKKEIESLFFLENSHSMAGELCISIIRNLLEKNHGNPRHFPIGINIMSRQDHFGILEPLAKQLQVHTVFQDNTDIQESTNEIINKICQSICTGSVIFFEINNWNNLTNQCEIIRWFLDDFWQPLVSKCKNKKDTPGIKIICVIDAEYPIESEYKQVFKNYSKLIELPLTTWNEKHINEWLVRYSSCFINYQSNLTGSKINEIGKQIFLKTNKGIPRMVSQELEDLPKRLVNCQL
ncbi:hypothetical protein [Brunnivagina elsteri]|uniref:Uncharacterized protein n=1 Tax=Brunnivagina elsteri CCALA 953 TaxID=987040 RepID=A0A2A2TKQ3_9CYAN|nr:hypothetical protein [Calothrix elsteri]PAX57114.1 hypothetical protein CK510_09415 [Calothrix elsteri CCALA 953]